MGLERTHWNVLNCLALRAMGRRTLGAAALRGLVLLSAGLTPGSSLLARPGQESPPAGDDLPAPNDKVRCPDCNLHGKMTCTDCGGKGELERDCKICGGSGSRPCLVCRKEENAAGQGLLTCGYCGGKGAAGAAAKPCQRCEGKGTIACSTCLGKGDLPCRKKVPDKICPRCRFVGKVTCETCAGEALISPELLAARKRSREKVALSAARSGLQNGDGPQSRAAAKADDSTPVKMDSADLEKRFVQLSETHGHHLEVFSIDPRSELDPVRSLAAQLLQKLRGGKQEELVSEIDRLLDRLQNLRRRWAELRDLFGVEHKTYGTVEEVWGGRKEALAAAPQYSLAAESGRWDQRLDLALRICEKSSYPLVEEEPEWLVKEAADLRKLWEWLKPQGEAALNGLEASAADKARAAAAKPATRRGPEPHPPKSAAGSKPVAAVELKTANGGKEKPAPAPAVIEGGTHVEERPADSGLKGRQDRPSARPAGRAAREPPADKAASASPSRLLWTLAGFGLACFLFLLARLRQKNAVEEREDSLRKLQ